MGSCSQKKRFNLLNPRLISQGTYQPQPHIAQELLNFPDENLTLKQIQQFLGIVNYIRDFIPDQPNIPVHYPNFWKKTPRTDDSSGRIQEDRPKSQPWRFLEHARRYYKCKWSLLESYHDRTRRRKELLLWPCQWTIQESWETLSYYIQIDLDSKKMESRNLIFIWEDISFRFTWTIHHFHKFFEFKNKMPPYPQILRLKDWFSKVWFFCETHKREE